MLAESNYSSIDELCLDIYLMSKYFSISENEIVKEAKKNAKGYIDCNDISLSNSLVVMSRKELLDLSYVDSNDYDDDYNEEEEDEEDFEEEDNFDEYEEDEEGTEDEIEDNENNTEDYEDNSEDYEEDAEDYEDDEDYEEEEIEEDEEENYDETEEYIDGEKYSDSEEYDSNTEYVSNEVENTTNTKVVNKVDKNIISNKEDNDDILKIITENSIITNDDKKQEKLQQNNFKDIVEFLRSTPKRRCKIDEALQYFSKKEIETALRIGRVLKTSKDGKITLYI